MTPAPAPRGAPRDEPRVLTLPQIDDVVVPGWRFTRRALTLTLSVVGLLALAAVVTSLVASVQVTVDGTGLLEPVAVWPVRPVEGGVISAVLAKTGDTVIAGQPLARLDDNAAALAVSSLKTRLAAARTDVARLTAQSPIDRARLDAEIGRADAVVSRARTTLRERMVEMRVTGDPDSVARAVGSRVHIVLDGASADFQAASAGAAAARAQRAAADLTAFDIRRHQGEIQGLERELAAATQRLARHTILAPAAGVLLTDALDRLVGASVQPGEAFMELGDLRGWRAQVAVSERDVHRIRVGDRADVEVLALSALPDDRISGRVQSIGWQPASPGAGSAGGSPLPGAGPGGYRVLVTLDSAEVAALGRGMLRRGYAVQGKIVTRAGRILPLVEGYLRDRARGITR